MSVGRMTTVCDAMRKRCRVEFIHRGEFLSLSPHLLYSSGGRDILAGMDRSGAWRCPEIHPAAERFEPIAGYAEKRPEGAALRCDCSAPF